MKIKSKKQKHTAKRTEKLRRKNPPLFTKANAWKWIDENIEQFRINGKIDRIQLEQALYNYFGRKQVTAYIRRMDWDWFNSLITEAIGEYEYKRQIRRVNPRRTTQHKRQIKNHRKRNPHDPPWPVRIEKHQIRDDDFIIEKKIIKMPAGDIPAQLPTQFKHYGEPVGIRHQETKLPPIGLKTGSYNLEFYGIPIPTKIPENRDQAFEFGRLLGIRKGLECENPKLIENLFKILTGSYRTLDVFFNTSFKTLDIIESFKVGVLFGLKYAIKYCGVTKFMQRRDELRKTNRELIIKFDEYI